MRKTILRDHKTAFDKSRLNTVSDSASLTVASSLFHISEPKLIADQWPHLSCVCHES